MDDKLRTHLDKYLNYWVIGIVSLLALFFLPFLGSAAGLALVLPTTAAGWIVYVSTKIIIATINVLLFHCFFQQSKVNIKDNPRYVEALRILDKYKIKKQTFRSPEKFTRSSYLNKGTTIFITTILGAFSLTQALLIFDLVMFLTYLFTLILGVIFGVLNMKSSEIYWTEEMWYYAKQIEQEQKQVQKEEINNDSQQHYTSQSSTAGGEEQTRYCEPL